MPAIKELGLIDRLVPLDADVEVRARGAAFTMQHHRVRVDEDLPTCLPHAHRQIGIFIVSGCVALIKRAET